MEAGFSDRNRATRSRAAASDRADVQFTIFLLRLMLWPAVWLIRRLKRKSK